MPKPENRAFAAVTSTRYSQISVHAVGCEQDLRSRGNEGMIINAAQAQRKYLNWSTHSGADKPKLVIAKSKNNVPGVALITFGERLYSSQQA